ncbi:MAG: hypothetical protein N2645_14570 [Clostridia bacterium]|nr:hypothetical protein [Clostridia bacterium]
MKIKYFCKNLFISLFILILITGDTENLFKDSKKISIDDAYSILCKAEVFSNGPTGYAGIMSNEIKAYAKLFSNKNAKDLFMKLENEGTLEGKLYALCALYYLDNDYYNKVIINYSLCDKMVKEEVGCELLEIRLNELIKSNDKNVVKLSGNKDSIKEWQKRNNIETFVKDFYGGGIPCSLKDYIDRKNEQ